MNEQTRKSIVAVDFDGTLCEAAYPQIGEPKQEIIDIVKSAKEAGCKLILWTMREDKELNEAVEWCSKQGIVFDAINDNIDEMKAYWKNNPRKVYADLYIDDRMRYIHGLNMIYEP